MLTLQHSEVSEVSGGVSIEVSIHVAGLIPGEKDRPKFVVLDDWREEGGVKY